MGHQCHDHRKQRARLAWVICLFFTLLLFILLIVLYFFVFKPKDPSVVVPMMQIAAYSAVGTPPSMISVNLGLSLEVYVQNPNRGVFHIEDSSTASLLYGNTQVGSTSLPISTSIPSQSFLTFGVTIGMHGPISLNLSALYSDPDVILPLPVSTMITIFGHVTTAGSLSRHPIVVSTCNVNIALAHRRTSIQSYVCERSHPLND